MRRTTPPARTLRADETGMKKGRMHRCMRPSQAKRAVRIRP
jgi:hypothetical protein